MNESVERGTVEMSETLQQALDAFTPELKEAAEDDPGVHLALNWSNTAERPTIYRAFQFVQEKYGDQFRIPHATMSRLMTHARADRAAYATWTGELERSPEEAGLLAAMADHPRHARYLERAVIILKAAKDASA